MKKAWETFETGRAQKAMKARQKFFESLQPKVEDRPASSAADGTLKRSDSRVDGDGTTPTAAHPAAATPELQQQTTKQTPAAPATKKTTLAAASKKGAAKEEAAKQAELAAAQELIPLPAVDEPLLDQPPPSKPKIILPPIDFKPFTK
jgi:hypothetical protein